MKGRSIKRICSVVFALVAALTFMLFSSMSVSAAEESPYGENMTLTVSSLASAEAAQSTLKGYDTNKLALIHAGVENSGGMFTTVILIFEAKEGVTLCNTKGSTTPSDESIYKGTVTLNGAKPSYNLAQTSLVTEGSPSNGTKNNPGQTYKYIYLKFMVQAPADDPSRDPEGPPTVWSIYVKSKPNKTTYKLGEKLDLTGAKITVMKSDYSQEDIDVTREMVTGFNSTSVGTQTLTIYYEGATEVFNVVVIGQSASGTPSASGTSTKTASFKDWSIRKATIQVPAKRTKNGVTTTYVALAKNALHGKYVKTVILPKTITKLEYKAFAGDKKLTTIKITSKTMTVEKGAFAGLAKSIKKKIKVIVSKNMSKEEFYKLRKALVQEGLKKSNIKRK